MTPAVLGGVRVLRDVAVVMGHLVEGGVREGAKITVQGRVPRRQSGEKVRVVRSDGTLGRRGDSATQK